MRFWNFGGGENEPRELTIDGVIAPEAWFSDDVTPKEFEHELMSGSGEITVWINSPGGDVVAASQIYTMLKEYPGKVTVKIDGIAASAASVVAMAGDAVLMSPTAIMMIHNPMTAAWGDKGEMEKAARALDEFKDAIMLAYRTKTNLSRAEISKLMDDETYMSAKKAVKLGFADAIMYQDTQQETQNYTAQRIVALQGFVATMKTSGSPGDQPAQQAEEHSVIRYAELRGRLERIKY